MPDSAQTLRILPEILLAAFGTLIMVLEPLTPKNRKGLLGALALVGTYCGAVAALLAYSNPGTAFSGMITVDGFATFFRLLVCVIGFLVVLGSMSYLERDGLPQGEFYALILYSLVGQSLMAASSELILIFLGLEISSISTYILAGFHKDDSKSNESSLKYFFLGSFATAFFLYGVAMVYGASGSTTLGVIRAAMGTREANRGLVMVGAALMFVGLGFKVSAAPFQVWTPDVYQGAPSPVTAFLSTAPKAAAFAIFLRIFFTALPQMSATWGWVLWISALLSMTVGNFAALVQTNLKRLLAYSSIAHAGYVLVAFTSGTAIGAAAAMFYLAAYAFMNAGAFIVVSHFASRGERYVEIDDYAGLGDRRPFLAALLTIFLLSLIGIPLTGGFFGKFYIFRAAVNANLIWLAVLGLLNSAVAAYYYLRVIVVMYMREPTTEAPPIEPMPSGVAAALVLAAAGVFYLGIFPSVVLDFATRSAGFVR
ncbi:MAG TPA: NADH-quinone oxidoreductase subunit N [Bryobacterales bacterium]|nr:NADH-quinone oxidoreductase subunit N [Bryobacterales bacterium]